MPEVNIPGVGVVHFPYDMPPDQIAAQAKRLYDEEQNFRDWYAVQAHQQGLDPNPDALEHKYDYRAAFRAGVGPGADGHWPSQFKASDHPNRFVDGVDTITGKRAQAQEGAPRRELFGKPIPTLKDVGPSDLPSDAAFLKRAPEVGGTAGMMIGGPIGAAAGAAGGALVKGQFERGAHLPGTDEIGGAALEGGKAALLAGAPRVLAAGARTAGPVVAQHAKGISKGISAISGIGAGVASGSPLTGIGMGAATKMLTSPGAIRTAGNVATRIGTVPSHAVNKAGFGALSAEAVRQALLDAMASEQP